MGLFATTTGLQTKMVGTSFDTATTNLASLCIWDAENEIKKQLAKTYDTSSDYFNTSTSIPPMVRTLAENLAVGYMYENMSRGSKEGYARADRYIKRTMENLKALQEGTLQLFDTAGSLIEGSGQQWQVLSNTKDYSNTFNEDNPKRWKISEEKLDDIDSERDE